MENKLKFKNKKFRIMLVADPHEKNKISDKKDKAVIRDYLNLQYSAIRELKPDLVILMGDNATGSTKDELKEVLLRITKPYSDNKIPFAFVLGNHDLECNVNSLIDQYRIYRQLPCCILPEENEIDHYGDYNIPVYSSDIDSPALNLWFMYSGNIAEKQYFSYYDHVKTEQIKWYESKSEQLRRKFGKVIPAINFQHIPVPEEFRLLTECSASKLINDAVTGQTEKKGKFYVLDKTSTYGYMGEAPCTPAYNNGQFSSWKKTGDVFASFFGHDHMNDFAGYVDGILLSQCKTAGFRPYGDGLMQGVRIIDINEDNPENIFTKMVYYRELVGDDCLSISGAEKNLRDRTSVKIDFIKSAAKISAPVMIPIISFAILKKIISKIK